MKNIIFSNYNFKKISPNIKVTLDDQDKKEIELKLGEAVKLPPGEFHTVHVIGDKPSMYMYIYQNSTDIEFRKKSESHG